MSGLHAQRVEEIILLAPAAAYLTRAEHLGEQLALTRAWLRSVRDFTRSPAAEQGTFALPPTLATMECVIGQRLGISDRTMIPLARLDDRCGLTTTERRVLWLLLGHELCPVIRALVRELNSEHVSDPTTDTLRRAAYACELGDRRAWHELAEHGRLRRFGLVERSDDGTNAPVHRQTWKVSERAIALLHGDLAIGGVTGELARVVMPDPQRRTLELSDGAFARIEDAIGMGGITIVTGMTGSGRRSALALATARATGKATLQVEARALAEDAERVSRQLRAIAFEAQLLDAVPMIHGLDVLADRDLLGVVEQVFTTAWIATASRSIARSWRQPATTIALHPISSTQRAILWQRALPTVSNETIASLATLYPLSPSMIFAAGTLLARRPTHGTSEIAEAVRSLIDDRMAGLANRVTITQRWEDLVLPREQMTSIVELIARVHERHTVYERWGLGNKLGKGRGVLALFSGPPGTGKTMAAGLVAAELGVALYQVDLSKIVSKWIGETEKNLAAVFDAAEAGNAILLFDEADALFAKRTEIKSSNDRHANQEVNYLLQRMESFSGIVILTTNFAASIDEAFRRRLSMHLQFPMPETDEREKLWAAMIPVDLPTDGDLGFARLAERFVMSGGYVRNAVLRAAFLAAAEGSPVTRAHLEYAARLEYEAMGNIVREE